MKFIEIFTVGIAATLVTTQVIDYIIYFSLACILLMMFLQVKIIESKYE